MTRPTRLSDHAKPCVFFFAFLDGTAGGRKAGGDGNGRGGIRQFRVLRERRRGAHVVDRNGPRDRGQGQMLRRRSAGPGPPAAAAVVGPPEFRGRGLGQRVRGQMPGGPVVALGPDQDLVRGRPVRRHRRMGTVGRLRRQISARLAGNGSAAPNDRRRRLVFLHENSQNSSPPCKSFPGDRRF